MLGILLWCSLLMVAGRAGMVCGKLAASARDVPLELPIGPTPFETHAISLGKTIVGSHITISQARWTLPEFQAAQDMQAPLVLIHSAFMGRLSYYGDYARALAGWGYAVLQYDLACWTAAPKLLQSVPCPQLENIADEEAALPDVIAWARQGLKELSAEHAARVQWDSVGLAGHSRGGTVAYHQLQQFAIVKAAVLLDPVREPHRTISPTQKPLFVVAGRGPSACAPERLGPNNFVSGQSPDEAAVQLPQAGHAQFWHAPRLWQRLADAVCGTGNVSDATIRGWAITLATAQMLRMHPPALPQGKLDEVHSLFEAWRQVREQQGDLRPYQPPTSGTAVPSPPSSVHSGSLA